MEQNNTIDILNRKIFLNDKIYSLFVYTILFIFSLIVLLNNPLAPFAKGLLGNDQSIFITIGRNIFYGDIPYKDIIDHKGPLPFFMNALGLAIHNTGALWGVGIWLLEVISMFVTSLLMYKTTKLIVNGSRILSLSTTCLSMLFIAILFSGDMTEEWALPYSTLGIYVFVRYLKTDGHVTFLQTFLIALSFVMAFLCKATYVAPVLGFAIVVFIKLLVEKKYIELFKYVAGTILFSVTCLLPFIYYFVRNGALSQAVYWSMTFNTLYGARYSLISTMSFMIQTMIGMRQLSPLIIIILCVWFTVKKDRYLWWSVAIAFIITVYCCSLGGRYEHYYISFMPLLVFPYAFIFKELGETNLSKILIFTLVLGSGYFHYVKREDSRNYNNGYVYSFVQYGLDKAQIDKIVKEIKENTNNNDCIAGTSGIPRSVYAYSGLKCANKVLANAVSYDITEDILKKHPTCVVTTTKDYRNKNIVVLLKKYTLKKKVGDYIIWKKN
jgi:hypothetical protein